MAAIYPCLMIKLWEIEQQPTLCWDYNERTENPKFHQPVFHDRVILNKARGNGEQVEI